MSLGQIVTRILALPFTLSFVIELAFRFEVPTSVLDKAIKSTKKLETPDVTQIGLETLRMVNFVGRFAKKVVYSYKQNTLTNSFISLRSCCIFFV